MDYVDHNINSLITYNYCNENSHRKNITQTLNTFSQCVKKKNNADKCSDELNKLVVELHKYKSVKKVFI